MGIGGENREGGSPRFSLSGTPLEHFIAGRQVAFVSEDFRADPALTSTPDDADALIALHKLQDIVDYRLAIQAWFARLGVGGRLVLIVPHAFLAERQLTLPSPWRPSQRRLYTPASLAQEVEEALEPNSYRVRWLGDLDQAYDYTLPPEIMPPGGSDLAMVVERIEPPAWSLDRVSMPIGSVVADAPDFAFEPVRTRMEVGVGPPDIGRILLLKLDHLGDLIMGLPALRRMRSYFPDATIDLVVGSWNAQMARELGIADRVISFEAFPRNSSEEDPNVEATLGLFHSIVDHAYDLAVDMRTDVDTRILLRAVKAPLKAGIGTHSRFPFMDIALPLDTVRNEAERAQEDHIGPGYFQARGEVRRTSFALHSDKDRAGPGAAIIWGPYVRLEPGEYIFDFHIDLDEDRGAGLLKLDIALDEGRKVAEMMVSHPAVFQLPFRVDRPGTPFEARIWPVQDHPGISFSFYGGRLIRRGRGNVLHQTEYGLLLVELIRLRLLELDVLQDMLVP